MAKPCRKPLDALPCCTKPGCGGRLRHHSTSYMKVTGETKIRYRCTECGCFESHYILGDQVKVETRPSRRPFGTAPHPAFAPLPVSMAAIAAAMSAATA